VLLVYLQVFTTILTLFVKTIPANSATIESSAFGTPLLAVLLAAEGSVFYSEAFLKHRFCCSDSNGAADLYAFAAICYAHGRYYKLRFGITH